MPEFVKAAKVSDLKEDMGVLAIVNNVEVALFLVEGSVYAIANKCAHKGGPLADGHLLGMDIICPWHGMKYDIQTGKAAPDAWNKTFSVASFETKIEGEDVLIKM